MAAVPALVDFLSSKGFAVHCLKDSAAAIAEIITRAPDAVLLDADLPVADGYEVRRMVRPYYTGHILFTSQDGDDASQLLAFERGADDFIRMPASPSLLVARIRAHLQHGGDAGFNGRNRQIRVGELVVDASLRTVSLRG